MTQADLQFCHIHILLASNNLNPEYINVGGIFIPFYITKQGTEA
jgi:hypothetical protein